MVRAQICRDELAKEALADAALAVEERDNVGQDDGSAKLDV